MRRPTARPCLAALILAAAVLHSSAQASAGAARCGQRALPGGRVCELGPALPAALAAIVKQAPLVGLPTGRPRGVMIIVHGGAWYGVGPGTQAPYGPRAAEWQQRGFITYNIDYRAGRAGLADVVSTYDRLARRYPGLGICAYGTSAGAHLSLMLAVLRPELACVLSDAGPVTLANPLYDAIPGFDTFRLSPWGVAGFSPITYARSIKPAIVLGAATNDPAVAYPTEARFAARDPRARLVTLRPDADPAANSYFVHALVSTSQTAALDRLEATVAERACARVRAQRLSSPGPARARPASDSLRPRWHR